MLASPPRPSRSERGRPPRTTPKTTLASLHFGLSPPHGNVTAAPSRVRSVIRSPRRRFLQIRLSAEPAAPPDRLRIGPSAAAARPSSWYRAQIRDFVLPALEGRPTHATIATQRGTVVVEFFGADAPLTVTSFVTLARRGYYNGLAFHRVVPNFVAQDGDPRGDGNGGPGYATRDELNRRWYTRGAVGMALSGPDTGGSQYFLSHSPQPHLDGHYTVFGHISGGSDVLDSIVQGDRISRVIIQ